MNLENILIPDQFMNEESSKLLFLVLLSENLLKSFLVLAIFQNIRFMKYRSIKVQKKLSLSSIINLSTKPWLSLKPNVHQNYGFLQHESFPYLTFIYVIKKSCRGCSAEC